MRKYCTVSFGKLWIIIIIIIMHTNGDICNKVLLVAHIMDAKMQNITIQNMSQINAMNKATYNDKDRHIIL